MVKKEVIDLNSEEYTKPVDGFRKGVTKKSLLKSMTDDDWKFVDSLKEMDERKIKSDYAYKLHILQDQLVLQMEQCQRNINEGVFNILERANQIRKNNVELTTGTITSKSGEGVVLSKSDLNVINLRLTNECLRFLSIIRTECSRLYTFVDAVRLDKNKVMSLEDYNATIENVICQLKETSFRLL